MSKERTIQSHPFYEKPVGIQWGIALLLMVVVSYLFWLWFDFATKPWISLPSLFLLTPVMQFCCTPFFTLIGMYIYKSPMLLVFGASQKKYDLHNGTSFDYLTVLAGRIKGKKITHVILSYYLEGLLAIIEEIETGKIPAEIEISGTSYFFSERTAKRFGFDIVDADSGYKLNLYMNIVDLTWMYSLAHGRFRLPNMKQIKKAQTTGKILVEHKAVIENYQKVLNR